MHQSELRSFVLVTPSDLVECRGSHRPLAVYRLADATDFRRVESYQQERWTGLNYNFVFGPKDRANIKLMDRQQIAALDEVLSLAKAKGKGEPLPDWPGAREPAMQVTPSKAELRPGLLSEIADPCSVLWIAVAGILFLVFFVAYFINKWLSN